jgi:hypothetical protein
MKGKCLTTEEKIRIFHDTGQRGSITETGKNFRIADVTLHRRKRQFGQMDFNEARGLKELEKDNTEPKQMLAAALLALISKRYPHRDRGRTRRDWPGPQTKGRARRTADKRARSLRDRENPAGRSRRPVPAPAVTTSASAARRAAAARARTGRSNTKGRGGVAMALAGASAARRGR